MPVRQISEGLHHFQFEDPTECPYCRHKVVPEFLRPRRLLRRGSEPILQVAYGCPDPECGAMFVATYAFRQKIGLSKYPEYRLKGIAPMPLSSPEVPKEVAKLSPIYAEILAQGAAAESFKLDQVAGMAYRKALEFLVKDFAIALAPADKEAIETEFLKTVITTRISDLNIQACAKRATWLGNDETHYVRRWTDKDITDLKALPKLTETWILYSLQTKAYKAAMPDSGPENA